MRVLLDLNTKQYDHNQWISPECHYMDDALNDSLFSPKPTYTQ
jgi:hypothetical protein